MFNLMPQRRPRTPLRSTLKQISFNLCTIRSSILRQTKPTAINNDKSRPKTSHLKEQRSLHKKRPALAEKKKAAPINNKTKTEHANYKISKSYHSKQQAGGSHLISVGGPPLASFGNLLHSFPLLLTGLGNSE